MRLFQYGLFVALTLSTVFAPARLLAQAAASSSNEDVFRRDNLMAWCIVPFDAKKRGPEERAAMLAKLGFKHFAYDYRGEHVPTFDAEIEALKKHGVSLDAWWFPGSLNNEAKHILAVCKKHGVTPQLWVTGGGGPTNTPDEHAARVKQEAARIRPIAEAAAAQGMKVGLYNHGGWFGEPENQLAIVAELKLPNIGIVYNQHHGHGQLDRFAEFLPKIIPHLLVLNLNGMNPAGDQRGQKIMQLGQGELDLKLLKIIRASAYRGPIGILGHTQDDAEARLADNLDGLDWLLPQLDGKPAGAKPKMRTPVPGASDPAKAQAGGAGGYLAEGKAEYRALPITVELRATLKGKAGYNILVANETKRSPEHWELFTMPGTGTLSAYLPGRQPDHVHTKVDICDGKPHEIAFTLTADSGFFIIDGNEILVSRLTTKQRKPEGAASEKLGFLRLVEGGMGCNGALDYVRISRGERFIDPMVFNEMKPDDATVGLWRFHNDPKSDAKAPAEDASKLKNHAVRQTASTAEPSKSPTPTAGVHLKPVDPALKVMLIDRSPDEVYMGVKADREGNVFVGGREGVFVFERDAKAGGFKPRRELLRFPKHSIIMGLEFKDDDLFVLTCNALYRLPGGRVKREGLVPERLLWGIPLDLHVSFHCLAWGPEGDLYVTHGDPLLNYGDWTRPDHWGHWVYYSRGQGSEVGGQKETQKSEGRRQNEDNKTGWRKTPYTGQGAVLRYSLKDGAVNVVATGLRGPVGLAFDDHWNLFTNDNDHESRADQYAPAKLLHVVPGIDFGWPRGWMASKTPERFDLVEPVCDLGRGVPCDLAFYDRTHLPESVQGRLLHARWDRYSVTGYKMTSRGTSFSAKEETILQGDDNCRPVGLAVGPGGELFVTALYMTGNMSAPYCASDLMIVTRSDDPPRTPQSGAPVKIFTLSRDKDSSAESLLKAAGADDYERQLAAAKLGRTLSLDQFAEVQTESDDARRLAGVLAIGRKLTVPAHDETPPESLPLSYPKGNGWFHRDQQFYGSDDIVDLADFARIGSYTIAERWKAVPHSEEQEKLFALLLKALDDPSERVKLQAAYFLGLLRDPRSEPKIEAVRRTIAIAKLQAAATLNVREAWCMGPFASQLQQKASTQMNAAPESGSIDLTTKYRGQAWEKRSADRVVLRAGSMEPNAEAPWLYVYFSVQSRVKQPGLVSVAASLERRLWVNGREVAPGGDAGRREGEIVELQPGGNELLLKFPVTPQQAASAFETDIRIQASDPIQLTLADRFDSSLLAARLRDAAAAGGAQPIAKEFLEVDWTKEAVLGDAVAGRKLFGTLACTKCHAITADQKSAGAPSLLGAKLRFTVPHLVESMLLPSRQVAEPFRAQTFTTTAGLTVTGLVVGETTDSVELLLPDATRKTLAVKEIEERSPTTLSPMPQGLVKTPQELRDLLAYLLSEKPTPP